MTLEKEEIKKSEEAMESSTMAGQGIEPTIGEDEKKAFEDYIQLIEEEKTEVKSTMYRTDSNVGDALVKENYVCLSPVWW